MQLITAPYSGPLRGRAGVERWLEEETRRTPWARRLGTALYRHRGLALIVFATFVLLAAAVALLIRPYYQATGSLVLDRPPQRMTQLHETGGSYSPSDEDRDIQTQLTVLHSQPVAARVIAQLKLEQNDPQIKRSLDDLAASLAKKHEQASPALRLQIAEGIFLNKLSAAPDKLSRTVLVSYGAQDAALAAAVVNQTMSAFGAYAQQRRLAAGVQMSQWLNGVLQDVARQRQQAETALVAFQQQHAYTPLVVPGGQQNVLLEQLDLANRELTATEAQRLADNAALQAFQGDPQQLPEAYRTPELNSASAAVEAAQAHFDELRATYRRNFPAVTDARQQLHLSQAALAHAVVQLRQGLGGRVQQEALHEAELTALVRQLRRRAAGESATEIRYQNLKGQADLATAVYNDLHDKLSEATLAASLPSANLRPLNRAQVPLLPQYPNRPLYLLLGVLLGAAFAIGAALVRERWQGVVTGPEDGETPELLPSLGVIPLAPSSPTALRSNLRGTRLLAAGAANLNGPLADYYAKLAARVAARCPAPHKMIVVSSTHSGEGKTETVCNLGRALAQAGYRTLIVDADPLRPGCATLLSAPSAGGEVQGLGPNLELYVPNGNGTATMLPRKIAEQKAVWTGQYDYVLLDSPAASRSGDALLLSRLSDAVVLVARWGFTRQQDLANWAEDLARAGAPLLGTVLNGADLSAPGLRGLRAAPRLSTFISVAPQEAQ